VAADFVPHPEKIAEESAPEADASASEADRAVVRGQIEEGRGMYLDAVRAYGTALSWDRDHADALRGLIRVAFGTNDSAAAITILEKALDRRPQDGGLHGLLAKALSRRGEGERALEMLDMAVSLGSEDRAGWADIAEAAQINGEPATLLKALDAAEDAPSDSHIDDQRLAAACGHMNWPRRAITFCERCIERVPDIAMPYADLAAYYHVAGHVERAAELVAKAAEMKWDEHILQRRVFISYFDPAIDGEILSRYLREWDAALPRPQASVGWRVKPDPDRKLRIGYVGADFRSHSNGFAFAPLFRGWNDQDFELFAYNTTEKTDSVTDRFRTVVTAWRDVAHLDPVQMAKQIRADRIDILVDLISHTAGSRLKAFANKPAPIQVEWNNASGLSEMDWLLTDAIQWPPGTDGQLPEQPWRLDGVGMPFLPAADFPPPVDFENRPDRPFTFGFFNNAIKINRGLLDVLAAILNRVPDSQIALKFYSMDDPAVREDIHSRFARRGVDPARVLQWPRTGRYEHLLSFGNIDLALDPFPGNGGVTTWETLVLGVPLICLSGNRPNGRMSEAILRSLGLDWLVTKTREDYADLAVALATQPELMRRANQEVRTALETAPILDRGVYVGRVEAGYREMWRRWCATQAA